MFGRKKKAPVAKVDKEEIITIMKGRGSFPRKAGCGDNPAEQCKATRKGAVHWVGKPGKGGAARKASRAAA